METKAVWHIDRILNDLPMSLFYVQLAMWSRNLLDMSDQGFHKQVGVNFPSFYRAGTVADSGIAGRWLLWSSDFVMRS